MSELAQIAIRQTFRSLVGSIRAHSPEFVGAPMVPSTACRHPWSLRHIQLWANNEFDGWRQVWSSKELLRGWRVVVGNSEAEMRYGVLSFSAVDPAGVRYSLASLADLRILRQDN